MASFDSDAFDDDSFDADEGSYTNELEPGTAALAVTGWAPSVEQFSSAGLHPGTANLVVTGHAPTVSQNSLTVEAIPNRTFFQRDGNSYDVSRAGTYTGIAPDTVEEQLYASNGTTLLVDWTEWTDISAVGGVLSGVLPAPQGGMYRSKVRTKVGGTVLSITSVSANLWAVGAIGAYIGSSSATGIFAGAGLPTNANTGQHVAGAWTTPSTGAISILVNAYANAEGVPVAMMNYGSSGATLATTWLTSTTPWNNFVNALASVGNKLEFLFVSVGSNDADAGTIASAAAHLENLRQLVDNVRDLTDQPDLPVFQSGSNRRLSLTETQANYLHLAENAFGDDENCHHIQTIDLEVAADNIHLVPGATGYQASAARGAYQLINRTRRGPKASSVVYAGATVTVTLTHRGSTNFTPASAISGHTITDGSGTPGIVSVAQSSANSFVITCDRPLVAPVTWKHLSGGWPDVSANVFDNGSTALPMVMASQLASEAGADGTAPGATLTAASVLVAGAAFGQVNVTAPGATFTTASNLVAGGASGVSNATAPGATLTSFATLITGGASSITFAQAPAGSGYAPQRAQNTVRPAAIQRNKR